MTVIDDRIARWEAAHTLRPALIAASRRRGLTLAEAEDVAAEAILRAGLKEDLDLARASSWLRSVTANLAVDEYRRRLPDHTRARLGRQLEDECPHDAVDDRHEAAWVAKLVEGLPQRQAEILKLRALQQTPSQIAAHLGCSYKTVESLTSRARASVRAAVGATLGWTAAIWACVRRNSTLAPTLAAACSIALLTTSSPQPTSPFAEGPSQVVVDRSRPASLFGPASTAPSSHTPVPADSSVGRGQPRESKLETSGGSMLLPGQELGPVRHEAVSTSRSHEDETLLESATRCLEEGPDLSPSRIGCF